MSAFPWGSKISPLKPGMFTSLRIGHASIVRQYPGLKADTLGNASAGPIHEDAPGAFHHIRSSACRSILPVPVFGSSSMNVTSRGYL